MSADLGQRIIRMMQAWGAARLVFLPPMQGLLTGCDDRDAVPARPDR